MREIFQVFCYCLKFCLSLGSHSSVTFVLIRKNDSKRKIFYLTTGFGLHRRSFILSILTILLNIRNHSKILVSFCPSVLLRIFVVKFLFCFSLGCNVDMVLLVVSFLVQKSFPILVFLYFVRIWYIRMISQCFTLTNID